MNNITKTNETNVQMTHSFDLGLDAYVFVFFILTALFTGFAALIKDQNIWNWFDKMLLLGAAIILANLFCAILTPIVKIVFTKLMSDQNGRKN
jgi:hypothetical protein